MKSYWKILSALAIWFFLSNAATEAASQPPTVGGQLPEIRFAQPQDTELQLYLGIGAQPTFTIPEIKAEVVLIEIFSMY